MDTLILSIVVIVACAALIWFSNRQMGVVLDALSTPQARDTPGGWPGSTELGAPPSPQFTSLADRLGTAEDRIEKLYKAVADGIDHVDRNEKRVRGIVVGATRRFENSEYFDAGVDAELDTLPEEAAEEEAEPVMSGEPIGQVEGNDLAASVVPGDFS